ncbi:MAG: shikimate dehydrogenase [Chloroflexota bacterium]|nr:shikimate dehydrogenase [Dehalococcoidia bacterium]MDW8047547.1 shikimate dehydrogenase [Chloroflexota bacterium]
MTWRLGIIGHPVAHSLSPVFQQAAFDACAIDARYERWDTPPASLPDRVASLRAADVLGANVTIPHKEAVLPLLDELDAAAALVGAVNTILVRGGRLIGWNTDGPGFVRALRESAHFEPAGRRFLLVGAGGAARGIAFALASAGASGIAVWNRSPQRATALAEDLRRAVPSIAVELCPALDDLRGFDAVVNCTSVGMEGTGSEAALPFDPRSTGSDCLIVDIVYKPETTALLRAAAAAGRPVLGGLPMLIYQGALAFELWTGRPAPVDVMFAAARAALAATPQP